MRELVGDLWDFYDVGDWVGITTNGDVSREGLAIMGKGVAKEAAEWISPLRFLLGQALRQGGNHVHVFCKHRIVTIPVKCHWHAPASKELIERSFGELVTVWKDRKDPLYMVRPGCGAGGLKWETVKPLCEKYLDDRFVIVEQEG